jgi:hypothetical protein
MLKDILTTLVTPPNYSLNLKPFGSCLVELLTSTFTSNLGDNHMLWLGDGIKIYV